MMQSLSERDTSSTLPTTLTTNDYRLSSDYRLSTIDSQATIDYETAIGSAPVLSGVDRVAVFLCGKSHDFSDF